MSYILTMWLLVSGQWIGADIELPATIDCQRTAAVIAKDIGGKLVAFSCVLELDA